MKKLSFGLISCIFLLTTMFMSCDDDGYSLGDMYAPELATVVPLEHDAYYLVLDDGTTMYDVTGYPYKPKNNQRAIIYFTILDDNVGAYDYYVKIHRIDNILTKGVIDLTTENQDSIGNDAIKILRHWVGDDYLNIEFGYNAGGNKVHFINLVNNTTETYPEDGKVYLEFRHNTNGDSQTRGVNGIVAFDLRPYKDEDKDSIDFVIKVKDFDEEKTVSFTYKIKEQENSKTELNKNIKYDATQYN